MRRKLNVETRAWHMTLSAEDEEVLHLLRERRRARLLWGDTMSLNMIPMIDIVFQLLVYFLLVTNFTVADRILPLKVGLEQRLGAGETIDPFDLPEEPVEVRVRTQRTSNRTNCVVDVGTLSLGPVRTLSDLEEFLAAELRREGNEGGMFTATTPIRIVPDGACRWEDAVGAMNACLRAGYANVTMREPSTPTSGL